MVRAGWSRTTLEAYASGVKKFKDFTTLKGLTAFPALDETVEKFIVWAGHNLNRGATNKPIKVTTITKYLTALRTWHAFHGFNFPNINLTRLKTILRASSRLEARAPTQKVNRQPVTPKALLALVANIAENEVDSKGLTALVLTAYWGLGRCRTPTQSSVG
ncbi:hypothetical protein DFH28DRAFT_883210 [Melampsora americana]|nr:hypothetical protein DFH28DRAFT_883210 [Melampsora americana]